LLGRRRKWRHVFRADHIPELSNRFLENFTIFIAHPEDGRDRYSRPLEGVIEHHLSHSPNLLPSFRKMLEQHKFWHAGQAELQATADYQGGQRRKKTGKKRIEPQEPIAPHVFPAASTAPPNDVAPPPIAEVVSPQPAVAPPVPTEILAAANVTQPAFHEWLKKQMEDLGITSPHQLTKEGGPRPETIDSVLSGRRHWVSTQRKLVNAIKRLRAKKNT
jgi:hypothetical protein